MIKCHSNNNIEQKKKSEEYIRLIIFIPIIAIIVIISVTINRILIFSNIFKFDNIIYSYQLALNLLQGTFYASLSFKKLFFFDRLKIFFRNICCSCFSENSEDEILHISQLKDSRVYKNISDSTL